RTALLNPQVRSFGEERLPKGGIGALSLSIGRPRPGPWSAPSADSSPTTGSAPAVGRTSTPSRARTGSPASRSGPRRSPARTSDPRGSRDPRLPPRSLLPASAVRAPMLLVTTWFGSFLVDEGAVIEKRLFPKDPEALAERLALVEDWKVLNEERALMALHPEAFVTEPRLERAGAPMTSERAELLKPEAFGYDRRLLHAAMLRLARRQMRKAVGPDDHLHQAVGALDDLQETQNVLMERLRE